MRLNWFCCSFLLVNAYDEVLTLHPVDVFLQKTETEYIYPTWMRLSMSELGFGEAHIDKQLS